VIANSFGNFVGTENASALGQPYGLVRTGSEWGSLPLDSPFSEFSLYTLDAVSPDFRSSLWSMFKPAHPNNADVYRGPPEGPFTRVGPEGPPGVEGPKLGFEGASEDLSRSVYVDPSPNAGEGSRLWPGDTTANGRLPSLYEYAGVGNSEPRLVGVSDVGVPSSVAASHLISNCGTSLGSFPANREAYNAVSASGAKVFFTSASASSCGAPGPAVDEVYARIEGARTVAISEPSASDCEECDTSSKADARFSGASRDGSKVFFTTGQHLLPGATGVGPYLYEYDFDGPAGGRVTLVSVGDVAGPGVLGVARLSDDGSHVYFVAQGVLTGANREGKAPISGAPNLYVWTRKCPGGGAACEVPHGTLVAVLSATDGGDWNVTDQRPVQATPDGRFLVFQSVADLTADQEGRQEAGQIFEYDAETEELMRVSRGQGGYNENGNSGTYAATFIAQNYAGAEILPRTIFLTVSADGSRVFFMSKDALTPQALGSFNNVYEYREGRVSLISDGRDVVSTFGLPAVELIGTDASGLDVFFMTADRLVPQDTDVQTDLYDARVDGGSAPVVVNAPCAGDPCQGAASVLPSPPIAVPVVGEAPMPVTGVGSTHKAKPKRKTKVKPKKRKHSKKGVKRGSRRSQGLDGR
jgi:hypothetical protein